MGVTHKFDEVVQARYELDLIVLQTFDELHQRVACMEAEMQSLEKRIVLLQQEIRRQSLIKVGI